MATANYKMLNDLQVLVAIRQTRMSVFAIEGVGDDAVVAAGALLRDVLPALKKLSHRGQVFRFKPTTPRAEPAHDAFAKLAARVDGRPADEVFDELQVPGWRTDKAPHPDA